MLLLIDIVPSYSSPTAARGPLATSRRDEPDDEPAGRQRRRRRPDRRRLLSPRCSPGLAVHCCTTSARAAACTGEAARPPRRPGSPPRARTGRSSSRYLARSPCARKGLIRATLCPAARRARRRAASSGRWCESSGRRSLRGCRSASDDSTRARRAWLGRAWRGAAGRGMRWAYEGEGGWARRAGAKVGGRARRERTRTGWAVDGVWVSRGSE